jgi:hypothetical protein
VVQIEFADQAVYAWGSPITTTGKGGIDFAEIKGVCQGVRISGVKVGGDVVQKSGGFVVIYGNVFVFFTQVSGKRSCDLPWGVYRHSSVIFHMGYGAFSATACGFDNVVNGGVIVSGSYVVSIVVEDTPQSVAM